MQFRWTISSVTQFVVIDRFWNLGSSPFWELCIQNGGLGNILIDRFWNLGFEKLRQAGFELCIQNGGLN